MIERLNYKKANDVLEFLNRVPDKYKDFYISVDTQRLYLKNNLNLIKKVLKYQECYGLYNPHLSGLFLIYREKGKRPTIKLLTINKKIAEDFATYIIYNYKEVKLFARLNRRNDLVLILKKNKFIFRGYKGYKNSEIVLCKFKLEKRENVNGKHNRESKRPNS